jgi:Protein kinase domain
MMTANRPAARPWRERLASWRPRLLTRIALALMAVGLLPLGAAAYRLTRLTEDAMVEQVLRAQAVAARTAAERVGAFLAVRRSLVAGTAASTLLGGAESAAAEEFLRRSLAAWGELGVLAIAVDNERGDEVLRAQWSDVSDRERAGRALAWTGTAAVRAVPDEEPLLLLLQLPLASGAGMVRVVCDGTELRAILPTGEMGETAELLLVDGDRRVLVGVSNGLAGFPPELVDNALSGKVSGVVRRMRAADGAWFLGAYAPVPEAPWAVLARQPSHIAEEVGRSMRRSAQLSFGGAAVLIALIAAGAYRTVVAPIRELVTAQRRLGKAGAESSAGDEIAELRESFAVLEQRVRDREALDRVFLGRYQILDTLGGGGMGTVFKAWDPKLQRTVALKTIRLEGRSSESERGEHRATLLQEAVTIARLNHPNIVAVYDLEDAGESGAYVAMEFVDGCSLSELLYAEGQLDAARVGALGLELARGLQAAHARAVLHRDVKPANVMLGRDGSVKLADFGIAELVSSARANSDRIFGTPGYVPPETLAGLGYGYRGDLFALGAVLYEALTGEGPFRAHSVAATIGRTIAAEIVRPGLAAPGVPPALESIVLRLLAREPTMRPESATEVVELFERLVRAENWKWSLVPAFAEAAVARERRREDTQWLPTGRGAGE